MAMAIYKNAVYVELSAIWSQNTSALWLEINHVMHLLGDRQTALDRDDTLYSLYPVYMNNIDRDTPHQKEKVIHTCENDFALQKRFCMKIVAYV